jgi:UDP-N-acetylmuramoyl-tripeptide--D-alanyl-D-alanine ligase
MEIQQLYHLYKQSYKVATDTRAELTNTIFFALKGDNFNGNAYAEKALEKGANFAVVDEKEFQTNDKIILVEDVLKTLQNLATYHRNQLKIPIISLTGSNGKTTTKELIHAVLKQKYNCIATKGNLNNHIGVPLTLLSMSLETEIGVVEMGANHPNEIATLCEIALPDYGYITNFGRVHLEGFKSLEGVIQAKTEMYRHLKAQNKTVFVNTNDKTQMERANGIKMKTFGDVSSDFPITFISADPFVSVQFKNTKVHSKLIGKYNFSNMAAAITFGQFFDISDSKIKEAIESYIPSNNRSQIIQKGTVKIILDAYNANPNSMEVALENLSQLSDKTKIAILGDMFEIGENSFLEHQNIANLLQSLKIQKAYLIGINFSKIKLKNTAIKQFSTFEDFKNNFDANICKEATVLIKASRGMALERVVELL